MTTMNQMRFSYSAILILGVAYAVFQVMSLPVTPFLLPDSASYYNFLPIRSATYPLILKWLGPQLTMLAQPTLYAAAATALSLCTLAIGRGAPLAFAVVIFCFINPEVNTCHGQIMTESLYMTALLVFLVAVVGFFRQPGWPLAMITALVAGLAATVRPTGYALLPVLILMVLMARRSLRDSLIVVLAAAVLPMVVMVSAERFYTTWIYGSDATSLAGRHLFAKAVLIKAPPMADAETDPMRRRLLVAAEQHFAPIRDLLDQAPDANVLSVLSTNYETCLEYSCVADLRSAIGLPEATMNRVALAVGLDRLTAAPLAYARLIWRNYRATWVLYSQNHPDLAPGFTAFIAIHQPLPFAERVPSLADTQVSLQSFFVRPTMIAIGWLTGLLALAGLSATLWGELGSCPLLGTSLVAALALHGSLLWTAAVGVGISRYTIGLWPMIIVALMFAGLFVWRVFQKRIVSCLAFMHPAQRGAQPDAE